MSVIYFKPHKELINENIDINLIKLWIAAKKIPNHYKFDNLLNYCQIDEQIAELKKLQVNHHENY